MATIYNVVRRTVSPTNPGLMVVDEGPMVEEDLIETQSLSAAGAINLTARDVRLVTPGASTFAVTLAAPAKAGVRKIIWTTNTGGGTVTLALTNCIGGTAANTATFTAVNDSLILESNGNKWIVVKQQGVVLT